MGISPERQSSGSVGASGLIWLHLRERETHLLRQAWAHRPTSWWRSSSLCLETHIHTFRRARVSFSIFVGNSQRKQDDPYFYFIFSLFSFSAILNKLVWATRFFIFCNFSSLKLNNWLRKITGSHPLNEIFLNWLGNDKMCDGLQSCFWMKHLKSSI